MTTEAYAKLNLTLDITGRDERGYHLLSSVFVPVTLSDTVRVDFTGDGICLTCDRADLPTDGRNLCYRAAERFRERFSLPKTGIRIDLKKRIPVCAGLGGGSSDAAAVLRLLADACGIACDSPEMTDLAVSIGADVAFFLRGGACLAEGTGEKLTPLAFSCSDTVVVAKPLRGVSTPQVYRRYDEAGIVYPPQTPLFLEHLREAPAFCPPVSNHLAAASAELCPEESMLKEQLLRMGARCAEVTGSGSAVYGLFDDPALAERAKNGINAEFAAVCRFC